VSVLSLIHLLVIPTGEATLADLSLATSSDADPDDLRSEFSSDEGEIKYPGRDPLLALLSKIQQSPGRQQDTALVAARAPEAGEHPKLTVVR